MSEAVLMYSPPALGAVPWAVLMYSPPALGAVPWAVLMYSPPALGVVPWAVLMYSLLKWGGCVYRPVMPLLGVGDGARSLLGEGCLPGHVRRYCVYDAAETAEGWVGAPAEAWAAWA